MRWERCGTSRPSAQKVTSGFRRNDGGLRCAGRTMTEATSTELDIRVDRLDALFQKISFLPARPDLDPGPALDHLMRRVDVRSVARGTPVRVHLASETLTPATRSIAANAVKTFCQRRAQEERRTVRTIRRAGRRALLFALCFLVAAVTASVTLTY